MPPKAGYKRDPASVARATATRAKNTKKINKLVQNGMSLADAKAAVRGTVPNVTKRAPAKKAAAPKAVAVPSVPTNGNGSGNGSAVKTKAKLQSKSFNIYGVDGSELAFLVTVKAARSDGAVKIAVEQGQLKAGVPVVALSTDSLTPVVGTAVVREPIVTVEAYKEPRAPRAPKAETAPATPPVAPPIAPLDPVTPPVTPPAAPPVPPAVPATEKKPNAKQLAKAAAAAASSPPPEAATSGNPFAE